jgi:hypothetical protein
MSQSNNVAWYPDFAADAKQDALPTDQSLLSIAQLVAAYETSWAELLAADARVEYLETYIRTLVEKYIPDAMAAAGTAAFTMEGGTKLSVATQYSAHISKERQVAAHSWLRDNNHGALIKTDIKAGFGKGEDERAQQFRDLLNEAGVEYDTTEGVHWQTLKAFVTEQLTKGADLPRDTFGIYETPVARIIPRIPLPKRKDKANK